MRFAKKNYFTHHLLTISLSTHSLIHCLILLLSHSLDYTHSLFFTLSSTHSVTWPDVLSSLPLTFISLIYHSLTHSLSPTLSLTPTHPSILPTPTHPHAHSHPPTHPSIHPPTPTHSLPPLLTHSPHRLARSLAHSTTTPQATHRKD